MQFLKDRFGKLFRLTSERKLHILKKPELKNQFNKIRQVLFDPEEIRESSYDPTIHLLYRLYPKTPVGEKYLVVVVKVLSKDPFIVTAFFTDRLKSGKIIWTFKSMFHAKADEYAYRKIKEKIG
ncbi:MAG: hypothetical protein Q7S92_05675 [Candidatus Diapherotrites archaeon]|nr:hypothetical protein [Candidatus Diapherotrites archaeon]